MMKIKTPRRPIVALCALSAGTFITACSGGGGSTSDLSAPSPPLGGIGPTITLNQRVNFTVLVPAPTVGAVASTRRKHIGSGTTTTNPYVSPNTASVSLQLVSVNGKNPQILPVLVVVNVACPGTNGCSVPIQNVAAAKGNDRFAVQTFSGPGGTGVVISSSFIDVTVPSAQAVSFGGTALTVGGTVQSLLLAVNEPASGFLWNTPATGTVDVNAVDPAGAIIIGSDTLANAITVSLAATPSNQFTINATQTVTLLQPAQSLALAYNGVPLLGSSVTASTINEQSQPVATTVPIPVATPTIPPRPSPSPVPSAKPGLSLYVYDSTGDRILEYDGVNAVEAGGSFSTTPRRAFEIAPPPALAASLNNCAPVTLSSFALSSSGTIYATTSCSDNATYLQQYTFTYVASTQEAVPAQATPTPPIPGTFFIQTAAAQNTASNIALDEAHNAVFESFTNAAYNGPEIIGVPIGPFSPITTDIGATCLQELGQSQSCTANSTNFSSLTQAFAVGGNGDLYVPVLYGTDQNGNPAIPPGSASQQVAGEPGIATFPSQAINPAPLPFSVLAGFQDELGANSGGNIDEIGVEGSTLYALTSGGQITQPSTGNAVYAGLSGCPAPSLNASADTINDSCLSDGGSGVPYIAVFANAVVSLAAPSSAGLDVVTPPAAMIGGDIVGGFSSGEIGPGQAFAVKDGFAYVVNYNNAGEIDVYNTNGVMGYTTNTPPWTKFSLDPTVISIGGIAIGPTGTGIGGAALLRRPARPHSDVRAVLRALRARQQSHRRFAHR